MPCPKPPRTYCKDGVFFIRLFVPQRLAAFVARPKIVQSLKTRDRHLAYVRALNINLAFELWVEKLTRPLSEEELAKLIVQTPNGAKFDFDLTIPAEKTAYEELLKKMDSNPGLLAIQEKFPIDKALALSVEQLAMVLAGKACIHQPPDTIVPTPALVQAPVATGYKFRLTEVFETFKNSKEKTYSKATREGYFPRIQCFIDYCKERGVICMEEVRKDLAVQYREKLELEKNSPLTVDNHTKSVKQFFDYAIQLHKYNLDNPFANLHLVKKSQLAKLTDSYLPYSPAELKALFDESAYRARFGKNPDYFYSPIIALTMGLRLEELAQLRVSDVYEQDGIWVIDINDNGDDKEVKTPSSVRLMPLPRHVLQTDFLAYHAGIKKEFGSGALLYPYLIHTKNGYGKNLGYNFSQHKQSLIKENESQKSFHSLRKNLGNALKQKGFDLSLRKRILGHSVSQDVTETFYSGNYTLEIVQSSLDSLDFGIDFSKLHFGERREFAVRALMRKKERRVVRADALEQREKLLNERPRRKAS